MATQKQTKGDYAETLKLHVDELRAENERLRCENGRLREVSQESGLSITLQSIARAAREVTDVWPFYGGQVTRRGKVKR